MKFYSFDPDFDPITLLLKFATKYGIAVCLLKMKFLALAVQKL